MGAGQVYGLYTKTMPAKPAENRTREHGRFAAYVLKRGERNQRQLGLSKMPTQDRLQSSHADQKQDKLTSQKKEEAP